MESKWCNVIKAGQQVNVKVKEGFMSVEVEKVLFQAKLASTGSYFYATAKVIVRLSEGRTSEVQFRDLYL